jgi:cytochrome c peroxidase
MHRIAAIATLAFFLGSTTACQQKPAPVKLEEPGYFVPMAIPAGNPLTEEGVALGRRLFYDPILSVDSSTSCASCYRQELAFTDGRAVSTGLEGRSGTRNAISLANVGYRYKGLFWDGRAASLEEQVTHPITDAREMGNSWEELLRVLNNHPDYPQRFEAAFGPGPVTRSQVERALAQFQRTLISSGSKFDSVLQQKAQFSEQEERGFHLFFDSRADLPMAECGHCHLDLLFTNLAFENNGIEAVHGLEDFPDRGRGRITGRLTDNGKFRVPSLRNVALTAPYMHDGRFRTLKEVVDHYATGGHRAVNKSANVRPLRLNEQHKADLIAFLHTLTDTVFIADPRFSDPFKNKQQ